MMSEIVRAIREGLVEGLGVSAARGILWVSGFAHVIVIALALKALWPDAPSAAYAVGPMTGILLAVIELEAIGRVMNWPNLRWFDLRERASVLVIAGFVLAYVLSIVLLIGQLNDQNNAERSERQRQAEKQEYLRQLRAAEGR